MAAYDQREQEPRWQKFWRESSVYRFDPHSGKEIYSIDTPPRYTSGALHLGHATGYPILDFAARYRRMKGCNVFFPLCFDGNGMPVETATEKKYGITKFSVDRKTYLKLCNDYANQFIETMTRQFEMLGMSLDPSIYYETHSPSYRKYTQISFLKMLARGLAYRGTFPVNWCVHCNTSLADAEVEREQRETELHYVDFVLKGGGSITIATTRPELIGACKAVLVHPADVRYSKAKGKLAVLPVYGNEVRVIEDEKVEMKFGSGAVMICSYGDKEDANWILKHHLPVTVIIDEFGKMNEHAGLLAGMDTAGARRKILAELKSAGLLRKSEKIEQNVGVCWRCATPVEIIEKIQWFLKSVQFSSDVLKSSDRIDWYPEFMKQRLTDWTNSLDWDWVVSRQRLFATPVPIWECRKCGFILPAKEDDCYIDPVEKKAPTPCPNDGSELQGSTDVFDTWMDSSISALYNCYWLRDEKLFKKMFPMSMRGQAHEIIRTWAYYTVLRSNLLLDAIPWRDIMITGFIMAPDRTPMHTHLGNVIDPVPLIEKYGADALRYYAATCSLGTDQAFRERDVVHGQRLCNKLWNIANFVTAYNPPQHPPSGLNPVDSWIVGRYNETVRNATALLDRYEFEKAMRVIEQFAWHEFADNYIEMVKSRARKDDKNALWVLRETASGITALFAPFLPHVTEAIYQKLFRTDASPASIHVSDWPGELSMSLSSADAGEKAAAIVNAVRTWRADADFRGGLEEITVISQDRKLAECASEIGSALRAEKVVFSRSQNFERKVSSVKPNFQYIGPKYREKAKEITEALRSVDLSNLQFDGAGNMLIRWKGGIMTVEKEAFDVKHSYYTEGKEAEPVQAGDTLLLLKRSGEG